jgi:hypothetical protein
MFPTALRNDLDRILNDPDIKVDNDIFLKHLSVCLEESSSEDRKRTGLRLSSIGKEPILVALQHIGISTDNGSKVNPFTALLGYIFEAYAMTLIETKLGDRVELIEKEPVYFQGIKGNLDALIKTKGRGKKYTLEFKCTSSLLVKSLLEPEKQVNPYTGNLVRTGSVLPAFAGDALQNDSRGYITQLATYTASSGSDGGCLILFDKGTNQVNVVPLDDNLYLMTVNRTKKVLSKIAECKCLEDVVNRFSAPELIPQKSGGKPTGLYYLPQSVRYTNVNVLDLLYVENDLWDGMDPAYMYSGPRDFDINPLRPSEIAKFETVARVEK